MIKTYCDLCEKETNSNDSLYIPAFIAKLKGLTELDPSPRTRYDLCEGCSSIVFNAALDKIKKMKEKINELRNLRRPELPEPGQEQGSGTGEG